MRRQDQLNPIGHQSLTRPKTPCVRECVCNYRVFDVFFRGFLTFDKHFEKLTTRSAVTDKYFVFESRHRGASRGGPPERIDGESQHQHVDDDVRRVAGRAPARAASSHGKNGTTLPPAAVDTLSLKMCTST